MNITLIGFMGTGKTSVGKRLAKRLGWRFVDVDSLIESTAKKPVPRIFMEHGEPVFRRLEQRVIRRVSRDDKQVIATGGGAFLDPANRTRLRMTGPVICLTAKPQTIVSRLQRQLPTRPLLAGAGSPLSKIKLLLNRRARAYAQADLSVDTTVLSVDQVVERVWSALAPCLCKSWQYLLRNSGDLTKRYAGKYIVVVDERIIASGDSQLEAYQNAPHLHEKRDAGIYYVPRPEESLTAF